MTTRTKPKADSRNKGSSFEREIARALELELGIRFKRDLEQVRSAAHGDLQADTDAFPFLIECKRRASGSGCVDAWKAQACKAAEAAGKIPVVIYRFDRMDAKACLPLSAIMGAGHPYWVTVDMAAFCYVAREMMAEKAGVAG